ncbi:MAG: TRAP transporter substrate-binding protein [Chloroflexi bacterium]|nr:TRAP transporter substrate-binding protein [Chloroflexota bacterium]
MIGLRKVISYTAIVGTFVGLLAAAGCAPAAAPQGGTAAPANPAPSGQSAPATVAKATQGEYHFKFAVNNAQNTSRGRQELNIGNLITQKTNGKATVEVFWEGALGAERTAIEGVGNRSVEIGIASSSNTSSIIRPWTALDMPFLVGGGADGLRKFLNSSEPLRDLEKKSEEAGYKVIGYVFEGWRHLITTKRLIKTPDEMKGIKLRTTPSPIEAAYVQAFGGNPTVVDWSETYLALKQGIVEGYHVAYSSVVQFKMNDAVCCVNETEVVPIISLVAMNNEHFKALPADMQQAIMAAKAEALALNFTEDIRAEGEFKKTLEQDFKVVTYRPSADEHKQWRDTVGGVYQKFADIVSKDWVDKARAAQQ